MKVSANEVLTLAGKAARGGGAPPAQAVAFGRAALCHLSAGRDPGDLSDALDALPKGAILEIPLALSRLIEAAEGDTAKGLLSVSAPPALLLSYAEAQPFEVATEDTPSGLKLTLSLTNPNTPPPVARVELPDAMHAQLNDLAQKTLVPESAASRISGAGAGLTDND